MHFNEREYGTLVAALTFWGQAKKRPDHLLNLASAAGEMNALNSEEIRSLIEKINAIEAPDDIQESIDDDLHKELVDSAVPLGGNIGAMIEKSVQRILESGGIFILDDDDDAHGEIEASYSAYLQSFLWSVGFDAFENWRFVGPKTIRSAFSAALMKLETTFQGDDGSEDEETSVASSPTIPDMELAKRIANVITQATELKQDVIQKVDEHLYIWVPKSGGVKVGFLTPDEFAEISDFNAISLSAEYEHWYINSLGRAIRFIRGAQILDAKDEIVEVFSLASYLDTGRTNTAEYAPIFVEKSFHTPDSPQEAATCHAYQITDNGKQTGHGLCWMLVFLDSKNEPSGQFHVFSKASILFPSEPKGMDESYAYCVDFAKKYKLKVQKEKPRALEFCHGHRMMSKMDS